MFTCVHIILVRFGSLSIASNMCFVFGEAFSSPLCLGLASLLFAARYYNLSTFYIFLIYYNFFFELEIFTWRFDCLLVTVSYRFDNGDRRISLIGIGSPSRSRPSNNHISQHNY